MDLNLCLDGLIRKYPGSTRILRHHSLDFLHQGQLSLMQIYKEERLAVQVLEEIQELATLIQRTHWECIEMDELTEFVQVHFHDHHRTELPNLILLASKVERHFAKHPLAPIGLACYLDHFQAGMRSHMLEEEQVLFPALVHGQSMSEILARLLNDHNDIGANLQKMEELCHEFQLDEQADADWHALYKGMQLFMAELWEHISMENHFLLSPQLDQGCVV